MTPDLQILLIAVVFASQIFVFSFYAPIRWQRYHARLFEKYPREEYPRLHPLPREELERKFALFRPLHLIIGVGAALVLLGAFIYANSARGLAGPMVMCLLVQVMLPLYIALPVELRIQKGLSSMPPPSRRSVELASHRLHFADVGRARARHAGAESCLRSGNVRVPARHDGHLSRADR